MANMPWLLQQLSAAVREAFFQMHQKGMIYRANRLVNWCVKLNTTLSNLEVSCASPYLLSIESHVVLPNRLIKRN